MKRAVCLALLLAALAVLTGCAVRNNGSYFPGDTLRPYNDPDIGPDDVDNQNNYRADNNRFAENSIINDGYPGKGANARDNNDVLGRDRAAG